MSELDLLQCTHLAEPLLAKVGQLGPVQDRAGSVRLVRLQQEIPEHEDISPERVTVNLLHDKQSEKCANTTGTKEKLIIR